MVKKIEDAKGDVEAVYYEGEYAVWRIDKGF
jgi:hypothetical protein